MLILIIVKLENLSFTYEENEPVSHCCTSGVMVVSDCYWASLHILKEGHIVKEFFERFS